MFFIFGSPRSGTTLLAQCLNAHSEIVVPHETDFIVPLILTSHRIKDADMGRRMMTEFTANSVQSNSLIEFLSVDALREIIFSTEYHPGKILEAIYQAIARVMQKRMAGDKTPSDISFLPRLATGGFWLPDMKIIHIVRDARDMMASLCQAKWIDPSNTLFARRWSQDNLYLHFLFREKPQQYLLVHYEDMVREPKPVFRRICSFLGIEFQKEMLSPDNRHARYRKMEHHNNLFRPICDDRVGRFRKFLTPEQLADCEFHAQEGLKLFKYPISSKADAAETETNRTFWKLFRTERLGD